MESHITALWALGLLASIYLYKKWNAHIAFCRLERQCGCQRPRRYPHRDPIWGYDLYRLRLQAAQAGHFYPLYDVHFKLYGKTFEELFFDTKVINTMEPENIQQVAVSSFQDWGKVASRSTASAPVLGDGIFSQDGAAWKNSRELIKPTFSRIEIADLSSLSTFTDRLLGLLPRDGRATDVQPLLHKFVFKFPIPSGWGMRNSDTYDQFLDVSTNFIFGRPVDAMLPDTPFNSIEFIQAFNESLAGIGRRRRAGRMQFLHAFDRTWKKSYSKVHAFIDGHVTRVLKETAKVTSGTNDSDKAPDSDPPGRFQLLREMALAVRDPLQLRYQILNVFLAARDTTSILLGNALFQLARNPNVWTDLRTAALAIGSQPLTYDVIQSFVLFRHVLFEVIRLQGPAGRVFRCALRDTVLPVGGGPDGRSPILVKKDTMIALNVWSLHHDEHIWGEDVNEFKPQRWVDRQLTSEFVPFFRGPRVCPAQQQVLIQAAYVLVRLVQAFERIENRDPVQVYVEVTRMATESRNGVQIALFPAHEERP